MIFLAFTLLASQTPATEVGPSRGKLNPWVEGARAQLGLTYDFGGRKQRGRGIDCLGVVLAGAERATGCGWRSFPWNPTELVQTRLFGERVEGLSPVKSAALDVALLQPGDVVMLVAADVNPREPAIGELDGVKVWVWHTGVYSGAGKWIVGDHFAGQTVETELAGYLAEHADTYSGVFVTRPKEKATRPARCRKHAPL